jgi:hypothetical protein
MRNTTMMTADQMALAIMLDSTLNKAGRQRKLAALRRQVESPECPECGAVGCDVEGIGGERACGECGTNF